MKYIASHGRGFIYCVARKGVTGAETNFSSDLQSYLARCRQATKLPLALGFGVKDKSDVDFLTGQVDIAVIGTQTIRLVEEEGCWSGRSIYQGSAVGEKATQLKRFLCTMKETSSGLPVKPTASCSR
jgi:tryptophan synthase alpha subunit